MWWVYRMLEDMHKADLISTVLRVFLELILWKTYFDRTQAPYFGNPKGERLRNGDDLGEISTLATHMASWISLISSREAGLLLERGKEQATLALAGYY